MLALRKEGIPDELKRDNRWVAFNINHEGKKIPIDPKVEFAYRVASISDPETWGTFEQAASLVENGLFPAAAYAKPKGDSLLFNDLDKHLEKCKSEEEKKDLIKNYEALLRQLGYFNTYMEQSISGTGVHLLARGSLNPELATGSSPTMPLEIYGPEDARFIIMTGHRLNDFDISSEERTVGAIQNLHKNYFPPKTKTSNYEPNANSYSGNAGSPAEPVIQPIEEPIRSDEEVIRLILKDKKAELLWNGNWEQVTDANGNQKYTQQHYADMVLIRKLVFYTGNCPTQVDRLFRLSPCFRQYGRDGKWTKYESDIKKDIYTTSTTCLAVYDPDYHKNDTGVAPLVPVNSETPIMLKSDWMPDFKKCRELLYATDGSNPFEDTTLIMLMRDYIDKYSEKPGLIYIPNLFKIDRNINGATHLVKMAFQEGLKYSYQFGDYFIWRQNRYVNYGDAEMLIHPITEVFELVEHSVFHWIWTYVANFENPEPIPPDSEEDNTPKKTGRGSKNAVEETPKQKLEKYAANLFKESKKYVNRVLAQDVLKKYKGMDVYNDISTYYESPYINMQNGVLDLTTRNLYPHSPIYNQAKITNCDYDCFADCPEFKAMVERLVPDADERKELQKAFGLCLAKEQLPAKKILMLLVGPANTGKTTLLNTIVETLGEYGTSVDNTLLMQSGKEKTRGPEMYDFRETLMITTSESNESDKLDTGKVKALTGETTQSVRLNYSNKMDKFKMIGLIFIDSNFKPYIPPRDTATWGRLRLFPFVHPVKEKDPTLKSKLVAERPGIFNWLLEGLDMVLQEKEIFETTSMLDYKEQYKKEMDTTEQFLKDCIEKVDDPNLRITTSMLFTTYKNWAKDNGFKDSVRNKFYEEVSKSFEKKKSGVEYFIGLKFTELGSLYSTMAETTMQDFAKKKRKILEGSRLDLPYSNLRATHYTRTKEWFFGVSADTTKKDYVPYCCWCAERGLVPLRIEDFEAKVEYLKSKTGSSGYISNGMIENAKEVWSNMAF